VDLTEPAQVEHLVGALPTLDGLVYAPGVALLKPLTLLTAEDVSATLRLNFEAAAGLTRALVKQRRLQEGASLVYVASIAGSRGAAAYSAYSASKGALIAWARSLAVELAGRRVRVNTVSPGLVASAMAEGLSRRISAAAFAQYTARYPLGIGRPEDVAWAVCYLLAPASRWVTGTDLVVDGGVSAT
jgi:NAD(P)-dependent dehydrogenase (short-subunit alcohol dehydrogenase family)